MQLFPRVCQATAQVLINPETRLVIGLNIEEEHIHEKNNKKNQQKNETWVYNFHVRLPW